MGGFVQDIRYGLRMLARSPGFTVIAMLALALGTGANTVIFTLVHGVLLRPLPCPDSERIAILFERNLSRGVPKMSVAPLTYLDWKSHNRVFDKLACTQSMYDSLEGRDGPERVSRAAVTEEFFELYGVPAALGRTFGPEEARTPGEKVVVLSHGLWQRAFGGDREAIGKTLALSGSLHVVIGVMPPGFAARPRAELWAPLRFLPEELASRGTRRFGVYGRLKPGISLEQARAGMDTLAASLARQYPDSNAGWGVLVNRLQDDLVENARPALLLLWAAVLAVLLIACANISNLLLARAAAREAEVSIRLALGAGRGRLIRQLLTESLLLGLGGGLAGLLAAVWLVKIVAGVKGVRVARLEEVSVDWTVLGYCLGLSLLSGLLFGLLPAWRSARPNFHESLKQTGARTGTGSRRRLLGALVSVEVGFTFLLLASSGLLLSSFVRLLAVEPGFETAGILTFEMGISRAKYATDQQRVDHYGRLMERLSGLPGVSSAGAATILPLGGYNMSISFNIGGRPKLPPAEAPPATYYIVTPDYFRTLGIPLRSGRYFTGADRLGAPPVAIISETAARLHFPGQDPVGRILDLGKAAPVLVRIVGVVGDVRQMGLDAEVRAAIYEPLAQRPWPTVAVALKTRGGDPMLLVPAARRAILSVDRGQTIHNARPMSQLLSGALAERRLTLQLLGAFGGLALLLAGLGIYGVTSYTVTLQRREIGLRVALGAQRGDVLRLVLRQGMVLTFLGMAAGGAAALVVRKLLAQMLYRASALDSLTVAAMAGVLALAALLACLIPALRALRFDPATALRHD